MKFTPFLIIYFIFLISNPLSAEANSSPWERTEAFQQRNEIDTILYPVLVQKGFQTSLASHQVVLRRLFLDLTGTLPPTELTKRYLNNPTKVMRANIVKNLLASPSHSDILAMKWCDLLRIKSEFPIRLWPNAVQAYYLYLYDQLKYQTPYNLFVYDLLTGSGSNFREAQVNFFRAVPARTPSDLAAAASLTFLGIRYEDLNPKAQTDLNQFFSKVGFKGTSEWKEEIVYFNNDDPMDTTPVIYTFPDGKQVTYPANIDPRTLFATWLTNKENPYFTRNIVNRVWSWIFGAGIIDPVDQIRESSEPLSKELLTHLENYFIKSNYKVDALIEYIVSSACYDLSSIATTPSSQTLYKPRRIEAEVLIDIFTKMSYNKENYMSAVPEPFTFVPPYVRAVKIADGTITSSFLELFGRSARDSGLESERDNQLSTSQQMHLLNSTHIESMLNSSWVINNIIKQNKEKDKIIEAIYLHFLSRAPNDSEKEHILKTFNANEKNTKNAVVDLSWALINSKEFLFKH